MAKRTASWILVIMTSVLMVMSFAVPHHHHGDESIICLGGSCSCEGGCENEHSHDPADNCSRLPADDAQKTADGSCCGLKTNLLIHAGDSRRVSFQCDGGSDDFSPDNPVFLVVEVIIPVLPVEFPLREHEYPPLFFPKRSIQITGSAGLRAPPTA